MAIEPVSQNYRGYSAKHTLNTGASYVIGWLQRNTRQAPIERFEYGGNRRLALQPARWCEVGSNQLVLEMSGMVFVQEEKREVVVGEFSAIRFEAVPLSAEKAELLVDCHHREAERYVRRLLADMPNCWEEVEQHVATAVESLPDQPKPANVFRREGDYWRIGFNGGEFMLRHRKGLDYILHLLQKPEDPIFALELFLAVNPAGAPSDSDKVYGSMSEQQLSDHGLSVTSLGDAEDNVDKQGIKEIQARWVTLKEQLAEAKELGDDDSTEKTRTEMEDLEDYVKKNFGSFGRSRKAASPAERARVNVTRSIRTAIAEIGRKNCSLGRYLDGAITTGLTCCYLPDPHNPIHWQF